MYMPDQFVRALAGSPGTLTGQQAADERLGRMAAAAGQFTRRLAGRHGAARRRPAPGPFCRDLSKGLSATADGCPR